MSNPASVAQSVLRVAPGAALMAVAILGGAWAMSHHDARSSPLDGAPLPNLEMPAAGTVADRSWMKHMDSYMDRRLPARARMLEAHAAIVSSVLRSPVVDDVYLKGPGGHLLERPLELDVRDSLAGEAQALDDNVGDIPILWMYVPRKEELESSSLPGAWPNPFPAAKEAILDSWEGHGKVVDLTGLARRHAATDGAYFATDHHWLPLVAKEATDVAASELESLGVKVGSDDQTFGREVGAYPFFGSSGRRVTSGATAPDVFAFPAPVGGFEATMCLDGDCALPTVDLEQVNSPQKYTNRYAAFIGGDHGYVSITNEDPAAQGHVLLLKDSFGDAFATYLAERVAQLDVIDERHYEGPPLDELVQRTRPDAVIVLHNPSTLLAESFDPSVWTVSGNVETVEPKVVGDVAIVNSSGLMLQIGPHQTMDDDLTANASSLVDALDATGTPQLWLLAPRKEVVFQDLMPPEVPNPVVPNSAAVLEALRRATEVDDLTVPLSDPAKRDGYYLRTDHHWSVSGANLAVAHIVEGLVQQGVRIGDDSRWWDASVGPWPFYGSEAIDLPDLEPVIPDDIVYAVPNGGFRATLCVSDDECGLPPINESFLTEPKRETNRYRAFLGGTTGLMHLHNDDPAAAGTVVLMTDSFGAPVAVALAERTEDLYVIDERKWTGPPVGQFVSSVDADAVVVLHNPVTILSRAFNREVWRDAGD